MNSWLTDNSSGWTTRSARRSHQRLMTRLRRGIGAALVMAMAVVWSYFHKKYIAGSELSTNFLIVAPNVIVYQRLEKDFASNRIFHELPLIPPEWGKLNLKVVLRGEAADPDASGNLFLTNIHQLHESQRTCSLVGFLRDTQGPERDVFPLDRL